MNWITTTWSDAGMASLSLVAIYVAIIAYVRITGLRSFSKMSAGDFAMTVAVGSLFASIASSPSPSLLLGLLVLGGLFFGQWLLAFLRTRSGFARKLVDNDPLLLMDGEVILEANLAKANVSRGDLIAKLREANVTRFEQVLAVVFETTGDISVLHSEDDLDPSILEGVDRGIYSVVDDDR